MFSVYNLLALLLFATSALAADLPIPNQERDRSANIDDVMDGAISNGLIAGGVVLIGNHSDILFQRAYGKVSSAPDARAMTFDTVFDIASLTKVIATAPAVLKLVE